MCDVDNNYRTGVIAITLLVQFMHMLSRHLLGGKKWSYDDNVFQLFCILFISAIAVA